MKHKVAFTHKKRKFEEEIEVVHEKKHERELIILVHSGKQKVSG